MTTLILCATAKTSIRIAALLQSERPLLLASRSGKPINGSPGVAFNWDVPDRRPDISKHEQAQKSPIDTVYLVMRGQTVDFSATGIPFVDLCISNGVRRFVQLSGSALGHTDTFYTHIQRCRVEKDIEWTTLKPSWFMENFSEDEHLTTIQQSGCFYTAAGAGKMPMVSCDDIARVACKVITSRHALDQQYLICGPGNISYDDCAKILSDITGRHIQHIRVTSQQLMAALIQDDGTQMPNAYAQLLVDLDARVAEGKEQYIDDSVETLTGKAPTGFREFCEARKHLWME